MKLDDERHTGYFDWAHKWRTDFSQPQFPHTFDYLDKCYKSFNEGIEGNPRPIQQATLINLFDRIMSIRIDGEKQRRVEKARAPALASLAQILSKLQGK